METKSFLIECYKITFYPPSEKKDFLWRIEIEKPYELEPKLNIILKKRKLNDRQMSNIVDCILQGKSPEKIRKLIKVKFPCNKVWFSW